MAIIQQTITKCYCDICNKECEPTENLIDITTQYALNDRCYMYGEVHAYIPYGTSQGVVCKQCKLHYLEEYIKKEKGEL